MDVQDRVPVAKLTHVPGPGKLLANLESALADVTETREALSLALELRRRGGGVGAAALCGGGGQGDALILRVPA